MPKINISTEEIMKKKRYLSPTADMLPRGVGDVLAASDPDNYGSALDSWGWNENEM